MVRVTEKSALRGLLSFDDARNEVMVAASVPVMVQLDASVLSKRILHIVGHVGYLDVVYVVTVTLMAATRVSIEAAILP